MKKESCGCREKNKCFCILKHNVKWKRENFTFTISQFITHMRKFSVKQCPCLSSSAATLMKAPRTNVSPVCYHPCWTLTNPLASFTPQLLFFTEVIGKHPFTARLHTPIQNVASPSPVQAQFAQYFQFTWVPFSSISVCSVQRYCPHRSGCENTTVASRYYSWSDSSGNEHHW